MWSMFYLIIEFMKGSLPWSNIENKEVPHLLFLLCLKTACCLLACSLAVPQAALLVSGSHACFSQSTFSLWLHGQSVFDLWLWSGCRPSRD